MDCETSEAAMSEKLLNETVSSDSGISDDSPVITDSDGDSTDESDRTNVMAQIAKIDALLVEIDKENKIAKDALTTKNPTEYAVDEVSRNKKSTEVDSSSRSRVSYSGSWATDKAEDIMWASSMESKRYPIAVFNPSALSQPQTMPVGKRYHLTFKTVQAEAKLFSQILLAHGFQEVCSANVDFNVMWTGSHPNPHIFKSMLPHQRVNHFPRSYELTRKDRMYKNIERLQIAKGPKHFNFIPKTFTIPTEYSEFAAAHHRTRGWSYN